MSLKLGVVGVEGAKSVKDELAEVIYKKREEEWAKDAALGNA